MYPGGQWYSNLNCTCGMSVGSGELVLMRDGEVLEGKLKALTTKSYFSVAFQF
jgi:hypothetical protein